MALYQILISITAQKQLDNLPDKISESLIDVICKLEQNPRPNGCKKLKGRNGYRIRKGDYRIIYDIVDKILLVEIIAVGNRKDIYD